MTNRRVSGERDSALPRSGTLGAAPNPNRILTIDRILLPAHERMRI